MSVARLGIGRGSTRAGASSQAMFRRQRRAAIRAHWRDWAKLIFVLAGALVAVVVTTGLVQLVFAALVGALVTVAVVGWLIGDVRALRWAWGAAGERDTEAVLDRLCTGWTCVHDVPHEHGNWDHVLVGPPGVFVLDTKTLSAPAHVSEDALRSGRLLMPGRRFRGGAAGLAEALGTDGDRPWVQPVVVIWGDFEQRIYEEQRVTYVHASELLDWLRSLPVKLTEARRREFTDRVVALASRARQSDRLPFPKS